MTEREAMKRALTLALGGWGRVAPNPLVGAVLVRGGRVIAEGAHGEYGAPHAEAAALAVCTDPRGATCVVNLEPCAHSGKTPPCTDALLQAGIARVVFAVRDPHSRAAGGAERLRAAGVEVEEGLCRNEGAALNAPFLWAHARPARPFVALKLATSLDGFLADTSGKPQRISGPEACDYVHWLRAGFDAIAVGRRTAEIDDPQLTVRGSVEPRVPPTRVIFAQSGRVRPDLTVIRTAGDISTVVVTASRAVAGTARKLAGTGVRVLGADGLELAYTELRSWGIRSVLVEGGGTLAAALLSADLVDRLYWIQAPLWLGDGVPGLQRSPLEQADRWIVTERRALGLDTLLVADRQLCLPGS